MKERPPQLPGSFRRMAAEAAIYSALVAAYLLLVLSALGTWLLRESREHHFLYALLCLGLMLAQGIALEFLTTLLMRLFAGRRRG